MANILPFAETEPAILTDRDGFLANVVAVKAIHNGHSSMCIQVGRTHQDPE
jgi:hypothetical protein